MNDALRIGLGVLLILHGLVHPVLAATPDDPAAPRWPSFWHQGSGHSWLLSGTGLGPGTVQWVGVAMWALATVILTVAGAGVLTQHAWWRPLAIGGAVVSLAMIELYWHPYLALGVGLNVAILVALLWANWPTQEMVGS